MFYIKQAQQIANGIVATLLPHCRVIDIAGSVRRNKQEVKDIEIVCLPKTVTKGGNTLFEINSMEQVVSPGFVQAIKTIGKTIKGKPDGRYMQIQTNHRIFLDLFIPMEFDYYRQLAIRIGPAAYAHRVIATGWVKNGWVGSDKGLRRKVDCVSHVTPDNKNRWICTNENAQLPPVWESEAEFFDWIGVPFIQPIKRI